MHVFRLRRRHHQHGLTGPALAIAAIVLSTGTLTAEGAARSPDAAGATAPPSCPTSSQVPLVLTTSAGQPLSEGSLTQLYPWLATFCAVGTVPTASVADRYQLFVDGIETVSNGTIGPGRDGKLPYRIHVTPHPWGTRGGLGCGPNTIRIQLTPAKGPRQSRVTGQSAATYSASLTVLCSSVSLSPSTITPVGGPVTIAMTGAQFYPGYPVEIRLANHTYTAKADQTGAFNQPVQVPGTVCGTQVATVTQAVTYVVPGPGSLHASFGDSALLTVLCAQTLTMDPSVLTPGEATQVTGTGFTPDQPVTLTWQMQDGGPALLGEQTVTADGTGKISTYFLVMPNDLLGARQLVATQGGTTVTANAIVQGGSMEPSPGGHLLYRGG